MARTWSGILLALACFLLSLSSARNAAWEDPTGNSIFDPYESVSPPCSAVEAWEKDKECLGAYFELNRQNHNASGVVSWFPKWMEKMRGKYPEEYQRLGEVRFFASYAWGDSNFHCSMLKSGCNTLPSCKTVVERVIAYRIDSHYSLEDNLSEARRIYFMATEIDAMSELMYYQWNLLDRVKANSQLAIDAIVASFTEQPDTEADQICNLLIMAYTTVLEIGKTAMNAFGNIPETAANIALMAEAAGEMLLSAALETGETTVTNGGQPIHLAPFGSDADEKDKTDLEKWEAQKAAQRTKANGAMVVATMKLAGKGLFFGVSQARKGDAAKETQTGDGVDEPWLGMMATPASKFCSGLGGGLQDENFKRGSKLKDYILRAFPQFQGAIQETLDRAVNWTGTEGPSIFSTWLANHDWSIYGQHRDTEPDEKMATQRYMDSLISIAWRSAHCYQKCLCDPKQTLDKYHNPKERTAKYRYFPQDRENCVCQPQCWHSTRRSPFEKRLFGIADLGNYGHNINEVSSMSYNYYRANGNEYRLPNMDLRSEVKDAEAGISLPHCVSSQILIGDFDDESAGWRGKLTRNNNKRFPCTCGNWLSDETETFMQIFAMGENQAWMKSHAGDELFKEICPENLKNLPPLNRYVALCRLGLRWPHNGELLSIVTNQHDKYCQSIISIYEPWLADQKAANKHFCTQNADTKKILSSETVIPFLSTIPGGIAHNHKIRCQQWLAKED